MPFPDLDRVQPILKDFLVISGQQQSAPAGSSTRPGSHRPDWFYPSRVTAASNGRSTLTDHVTPNGLGDGHLRETTLSTIRCLPSTGISGGWPWPTRHPIQLHMRRQDYDANASANAFLHVLHAIVVPGSVPRLCHCRLYTNPDSAD
jgi:hypothetical protein